MSHRSRPLVRTSFLALAALSLACASGAAASDAPVPAPVVATASGPQDPVQKPRDVKKFNLGKQALALDGYDPVTYFPEGGSKPKKGKEALTATFEGVLYRFSSEETRKAFLASPARFEPQYGGWCAYAMADGEKVEIDPESYLVTDGKLYLFFKAWYADTRAKWKKDPENLQRKADVAWKKLIEPPEPKPK